MKYPGPVSRPRKVKDSLEILILYGLPLCSLSILNRSITHLPNLVGENVDHGSRTFHVSSRFDVGFHFGCHYQGFFFSHCGLLTLTVVPLIIQRKKVPVPPILHL
jgi:hypothetical protein